jgi:hypothetical protein
MDQRLVFTFLGLDAEDEAAADTQEDLRFKSGRVTLNETRDRLGKPRYDFPEADTPMVVTATGIVFIAGEQDRQAQAADTATQVNAARAQALGQNPTQVPSGSPGAGSGAGSGKSVGGQAGSGSQTAAAKADELSAFRRFIAKGGRSRHFVAEHLTREDVAGMSTLDQSRIVFKADDASREAGSPGTPRRDSQVAARYRPGFEWPAP